MMNRWITEKLLQAEMQSRNRIRAEYEQAVRLARRTEGWISGYSIKTKLHSRNDATTKNLTTEVELPRDYCESNIMYDSMCTICLLEVDDGDRVADLSCGHVFHPDCLGEWILKKVCSVHHNAMFACWYSMPSHSSFATTSFFMCRTRARSARIETSPTKSEPSRQMRMETTMILAQNAY